MKEWVAKRRTNEPLTEAFNTGVFDEEEVARGGDKEEVARGGDEEVSRE